MTERIDHTGRAENAMQNGIKLRNAGIINDATFQATLAQASATLALVEQQRIANLIAVSEWRHLTPNEDGSQKATTMHPDMASRVHIEAVEALGIS